MFEISHEVLVQLK